MKNKKQLLTGIIMLVVPAFFLVSTSLKKDDLFLVPYIAITVMAICGLITIVKSLVATNIDSAAATGQNTNTIPVKELLLATVFLGLCVAGMRYIGFYVTILVMLFLIHAYIRKRNSTPSYLRSLLFALGAWVVVYLVFGLALQLRVPSDVLLF